MSQNYLDVLFWVAPVTEMASPWQKKWWMLSFVPRIQKALCDSGYEVKSVIVVSTDIQKWAERQADCRPEGQIVAFSQGELLDDYQYDALAETIHYQETHQSSAFFAHLGRLLSSRLDKGYYPDIVVSFSPSPFFRELYPTALLLYHEFGMFSRRPYPETYYFDPYGQTSRNFIASFAAELNAITPADRAFLTELDVFRKKLLSFLTSDARLSEYFNVLRKSFSKILLMPLGYEGYADARINFPYQTQLEFVEHVLDSVDNRTAVVLTQHPASHALSAEAIIALKANHPNLIQEKFYDHVESFSQVAIAYCDACITQSSSLAYQAAFLGKYLVTVGGFCKGLADGHSVVDLAHVFDVLPKDRSNWFVWVIRHHITDVKHMPWHLRRLIEAWRGGLPEEVSVESWPEGLSLDAFGQWLREWELALCPPIFKREACTTVFFDMGSGYSPENACLVFRTCDNSIKAEVALPEGCVRVRVDPVEGFAILISQVGAACDGETVPVVSHNGSQTTDGLLFVTDDPQLNFDIPSKAKLFVFEMTFRQIPEDEALSLCARERQSLLDKLSLCARERQGLCDELAEARTEVAAWKGLYDGIASSTCWRMTKPLRLVLDFIKRRVRRLKGEWP